MNVSLISSAIFVPLKTATAPLCPIRSRPCSSNRLTVFPNSENRLVLGAWVGEVDAATVVVNDEWSTGLGSSLRAGLAHLDVKPSNVIVRDRDEAPTPPRTP